MRVTDRENAFRVSAGQYQGACKHLIGRDSRNGAQGRNRTTDTRIFSQATAAAVRTSAPSSVQVGVRLGRRGHREAQPRPAGGREAEVSGQEARHRFAGYAEPPPEIVILPPAAPPVSAGPSGYTENGSFPYTRNSRSFDYIGGA